MASLKTTDVLNDKFVETIIATLAGQDGVRGVSQSDIDENPVFTLLADTDALDSNVAAVLVADEMLRNHGNSAELAKLLPPAIGEAVTLLHADHESPSESIQALMESGNALAAKLAVSALTLAGDESQLSQARAFSDPAQLADMGREMSDVAAEIIEGGIAHGSLRGLTTDLAEKFVASVETLTELAGGQTRLKLMNQTLDKFRAEMAQGGVYLAAAGVAAVATPAVEPGAVASLAFDDILRDPIVLKTLKALGADVSTVDPSEIHNLDTAPIINLLIETNCLDSVSAAVLLVDDATRGRNSLRNLPKPVADALAILHDDQVVYGGPAALLATDNVHVHKVTFAAVTSAITGDEFKAALPEMDASSRKRMVSEMADVGVQLIERVTETNSWKEMSPELVDRFTKGLSDLANLTEGRASKRLIETAIQMLKEDIAGETAKDITTPKAGLPDNLPPAPKLKRGPGGFNA